MNAKDKANELIEMFKTATTFRYQEYAGAYFSTFEHDTEQLKKCALIMVDQIIEELENHKQYLDDNMVFDWNIDIVKPWRDVKSELIALK